MSLQDQSASMPLISNDDEMQINPLGQNKDYRSIQNSSSSSLNSNSNRLKKFLNTLDYVHAEQRGIQRVLPSERTDSSVLNTSIIWIGMNIIIPCFAIGAVGPAVYKLDLYESFLTILIANSCAILPTAIISCFGPPSGLRTMVIIRYSWGYYGASVISILSVISALGWSAVNVITGAQVLRVVFDYEIPLTVGILLIAIIVIIVSFAGYEWIHIYEKYAWIPVFIAYCFVAILSVNDIQHSQEVYLNRTRTMYKRNTWNTNGMLSFGASCTAGAMSWSVLAADYNTYLSEDANQMKIFLFTYFGNFFGIIPLEFLGTAVYTGTYTNEQWAYAYQVDNAGGLLGATLASLGIFAKILLILFSFSAIACTIPNIYSFSLSAQAISPIFQRIPRMYYVIVGTLMYTTLAIVAAQNFNKVLVSFMDIVSGFASIYIVVLLEEHFIFRRYSYKNYDFNSWNDRKALPISFAAISAGVVGVIGFVLGMSQDWYQGPISKMFSNNGAAQSPNLGFLCALTFTAITFPLFRCIELHYIKR
ncbi:unnamed protein product [Adineta ricciae]|uniref:Uncharacterized protein n=1 Tax=Adineta ricciae TaxID=249248 RepID=A0A815N930_ADIRI|nr:unnamed protein product [Adineta ricciae]CAF1493627.1 unnamed protein product [Adineta ricciae]